MSKTAAKAQTVDASLFLPGLAIVILYGAFLAIRGTPGSSELTAKRRAYEDAKAGAVPPGEVLRLTTEANALAKKVAEAGLALAETRKQGEALTRKASRPLHRIQTGAQIEEILKRRGLEVTKVQGAEASKEGKMATSLQKAASGLVGTLARTKPDAAPTNVISVAAIEAQMEAQRTGISVSAASAQAPPLDLRDLEVRGEYQDMTAALWDLSQSAGESVVLSIGLDRPVTLGSVREPLYWRLIVHVQPGATVVPLPPESPENTKPERLASEKLPITKVERAE